MSISIGDKVKLSKLCDITRGSSPRPIIEWVSDSGTPWVKISDATAEAGRYLSSTKEFIKNEARTKSVVVYPGELIVSNSATPGLPKFMKIEACIHDGWLLFRNFDGLLPEYLYYVILNDRQSLVSKGTGSIFTNLKTEILKNHEIRLPSLEEQKFIATTLGNIDDLIALNKVLSHNLELACDALFKSWFIDFEPTHKNGIDFTSTSARQSESALFPSEFEMTDIGAIPKGWKCAKFGDVNDLIMGQSPPGDTYNDIGEGLPFYQGRTDFGDRYPKRRMYCTQPNRTANPGDTLVSVRAPVGDINQALEECVIGRGVASALHKSGAKIYTYSLLKSLKPKLSFFNGEGTIFGAINRNDFNNLLIVEPSLEAIHAFEEKCTSMELEILNLYGETQNLIALRDSLLPRLMSGELKVPRMEMSR